MENLRHKKTPRKFLLKMHFKNVVYTYKSQILKFKIKPKVLNKKEAE